MAETREDSASGLPTRSVADVAARLAAASEPEWIPLPVSLPAPGGSVGFDLDGARYVLCNAGGTPRVIADGCPHAGVSFVGGHIAGSVLECPVHGGKLDLRDGSPVAPPIRRSCDVRTARIASDGTVELAIAR
jgi:naphthalene 1,2-dioxygenase system ferredoxin subunit